MRLLRGKDGQGLKGLVEVNLGGSEGTGFMWDLGRTFVNASGFRALVAKATLNPN